MAVGFESCVCLCVMVCRQVAYIEARRPIKGWRGLFSGGVNEVAGVIGIDRCVAGVSTLFDDVLSGRHVR